MKSTNYYYSQWRMHSCRLLVALTLLSNAIVWAIVAAFYSLPTLAIWLSIAGVFFTFVSAVEYEACDYYHTRYRRSLCNPTNQPRL